MSKIAAIDAKEAPLTQGGAIPEPPQTGELTGAPDPPDMERAVLALTDVLLGVAQGNFDVRAERTLQGDPLDVLAFLINSTAEEIGVLMRQLRTEQEELRRARDQLVQSAKLAALGEIAAGVAHELNQPLTAIQMLLDLLSREPDRKLRDCAREIGLLLDATRRMGRIVDGVRTFGRGGPLRLVRTAVGEPIVAALELLQAALHDEDVTIELHMTDQAAVIHADSDRMNQVFVNLLTNARDALRGRPAPRAIVIDVVCAGGVARYSVEDNGPGVPEHLVLRIFDPFFTTKDVGQGTGLGLSVSHGIVVDHGGTLSYEPRAGGGARFLVELPLDPSVVAGAVP